MMAQDCAKADIFVSLESEKAGKGGGDLASEIRKIVKTVEKKEGSNYN